MILFLLILARGGTSEVPTLSSRNRAFLPMKRVARSRVTSLTFYRKGKMNAPISTLAACYFSYIWSAVSIEARMRKAFDNDVFFSWLTESFWYLGEKVRTFSGMGCEIHKRAADSRWCWAASRGHGKVTVLRKKGNGCPFKIPQSPFHKSVSIPIKKHNLTCLTWWLWLLWQNNHESLPWAGHQRTNKFNE